MAPAVIVNSGIGSRKLYLFLIISNVYVSFSKYFRHRAGKLFHVADQAIGLEFRNRDVGISEGDANHRSTGATGDADIGPGIANHDRR